jgi:hypothetical protein
MPLCMKQHKFSAAAVARLLSGCAPPVLQCMFRSSP